MSHCMPLYTASHTPSYTASLVLILHVTHNAHVAINAVICSVTKSCGFYSTRRAAPADPACHGIDQSALDLLGIKRAAMHARA